MDRQQRHDLKHDKFVDEIGALSVRARANQRLLLTIAGAVVAIAVLAFGIYFYRANREENAQQALATAIETEVGRYIVGQSQLVRQTLISLLAGGRGVVDVNRRLRPDWSSSIRSRWARLPPARTPRSV